MDEPTKPLSAKNLLDQLRKAVEERDTAVNNRANNMFRGPMGIEERIFTIQDDISMGVWFSHKTLETLAHIESRLEILENKNTMKL